MKARTSVRTAQTALRRARDSGTPITASLKRQNTTSSSGSTSEAGPSSPSSSTSSFQPVLPAGQNPAYDAAIAYLSAHRSAAESRLAQLQSSGSASPEEIERLEVSALVNDPSIRRAFRDSQGKGQMDQAVMRHLAERAWKKEGGLDKLMQRVYQMGVVPDLLPELGATAPLTIKLDGEVVEPGTMQLPSKWAKQPSASLQLFHHPSGTGSTDQPGLYTLLVIDADHPSPQSQSFAQNLLFAKTDISLSVTSGETDLFTSPGNVVLDWQPPLPEKGTPRHRYVFLVLRQPSSPSDVSDRTPFNLRSYLAENSLRAADIQGISLIRAQWSAEEATYLSEKYREVHGKEMTEFGKPPKEMRYGYPLSASQKRAEEARMGAWDRAVQDLQQGLGDLDVTRQ